MRKKHLGILIFLVGFFLAACGEMKSQDISTITGISIARRNASRITPTPNLNQSPILPAVPENLADSLGPLASETVDTALPSSQIVEMPTQTATQIPTMVPSPTPITAKNIQDLESTGLQLTTCEPEFNRSFETELIRLINKERKDDGLPPLSEQSQLTQAARQHSEDMACSQFFSHVSPTNGDVVRRVTLIGYDYSAIGENIAAGYDSPESIIQAWMESTGHRANILNSTFTQIGVGFVMVEGSASYTYWTLLVGTP